MPSAVQILGVRIDDVSTAEMLDALARFVDEGGAHQISTVNTEFLMAAQRDPEFAQVLRRTALNVPDSVGMLWAAHWLGHPLRERVTGSDGIYRVAELCARREFRLYLLGAAPGIAQQVARQLVAHYPSLLVCGAESGSYAPEREDPIAARIHAARAAGEMDRAQPSQDRGRSRHRRGRSVRLCGRCAATRANLDAAPGLGMDL